MATRVKNLKEATGETPKTTSTQASSESTASPKYGTITTKSGETKSRNNLGVGSTETNRLGVSNASMSDEEKYYAAVNEASNLLQDEDENKAQIASKLNKTEDEIDQMHDDDLYKAVIDDIYENDYEATNTGREVRGENWWSDFVNGANNTINDVNTGIGNAMDYAFDNTIGNLWGLIGTNLLGIEDAGQNLKDAFGGEELSVIPDIAEDVLLGLIPAAGIPLVVGKNAIQNANNINEAISGQDAITKKDLTADERAINGIDAALNIGLSALPGIGKAATGVRAATKAGKAAEEATKAADKALEGSAVKTTRDISTNPLSGLTDTAAADEAVKPLLKSDNGIALAFQENNEANKALSDVSAIGKDTSPIKISTETTPITPNEALDSIMASVDRNAPQQTQLTQILQGIEDAGGQSLEAEDASQFASAIYNAMHSADDAVAVSSLNALSDATRYGTLNGSFGRALLSNAGQKLTAPLGRRVAASQMKIKSKNGKPIAEAIEDEAKAAAKEEEAVEDVTKAAVTEEEAVEDTAKKAAEETTEEAVENIADKAEDATKAAEKTADKAAGEAVEEAATEYKLPSNFTQNWRVMQGENPITGQKLPSRFENALNNISEERLNDYIEKSFKYGNNPISRALHTPNTWLANTKAGKALHVGKPKIRYKHAKERVKAENEALEKQAKAVEEAQKAGSEEAISEETSKFQQILDMINNPENDPLYGHLNDINASNNTLSSMGSHAKDFAGRTLGNLGAGILGEAAATNNNIVDTFWDLAENPNKIVPFIASSLTPGHKRYTANTGVSPTGMPNARRTSTISSLAKTAPAQGATQNLLADNVEEPIFSTEELAALMPNYISKLEAGA